MDAEEADRKPAAKVNNVDDKAGWTLMGPHGKRVRDTSPLPAPPSDQMLPPPTRPPISSPPARIESKQKKVAHNDGTLRITIKWKPPNFADLTPTDADAWSTCATDLLHFLFITAPNCLYHTWDTKATQQVLPRTYMTSFPRRLQLSRSIPCSSLEYE